VGAAVVVVVFYISGHGFGHASRQIELIREIGARRPDVRVIVRTSVPRWLFAPVARAAVEVHTLETDTGVVQFDSLSLDEEQTARNAARFFADFDRRMAVEAEFLRGIRATLVVGDIPPLACAAAERAGVPCLAIANFTWDWIYSIYPAFDRLAPDVIPAIRRAYGSTTRALRLPLHGGFEPMAAVTRDLPFIARQSARDPADTRRGLGLAEDRPIVLTSFGAYGADLPLEALRRSGQLTIIEVPREPPAGLLYQDLVAAADVVISKPGYGIVSECVANGTALLYTSRGSFREYDVFVEQMPQMLRCRFIAQEDLLAGRWMAAIEALMAQPVIPEPPAVNGADVAAAEVLAMAGA
jgi:UDP:flavonoid glycosyltransferase YjiC (YdhE family)